MAPRERRIDAAGVQARASHARSFLEVADLLKDETGRAEQNVRASLAVLAGIAAADAICGHVTGKASRSQDHQTAAALLRPIDTKAATILSRLLSDKSDAQYTPSFISAAEATRMVAYARDLVKAMDRILQA